MSVMQVGKWARGVALPPDWWVPKADGRTLDLNLSLGQIWDNGNGARPMAALTVSRPSGRGRRNPLGAWGALVDNEIGVDHDDAGTALGLQIEPQATYQGVSSSLAGAVAGVIGSGGAPPTGWTISAPTGAVVTVALGTTAGIPWIEINVSGTTGADGAITINTSSTTSVVAASGQTWTQGTYLLVTADDAAITQLITRLAERSAAGGLLAFAASTDFYTSRLTWGRRHTTGTLANASTGRLTQQITTQVIPSGTTLNWSLRLGGGTLTQTAYLPSEYLVGTSSAVRYADGVSLPFGSWGNEDEGTFLARFLSPAIVGATRIALALAASPSTTRTVLYAESSGLVFSTTFVGDVGTGSISMGSSVAGAVQRVALSYGPAGLRGSLNGAAVASAAAAPIAAPTTLHIGSNHLGASQLNGWLERLSYRPSQLSDADLQAWAAAA